MMNLSPCRLKRYIPTRNPNTSQPYWVAMCRKMQVWKIFLGYLIFKKKNNIWNPCWCPRWAKSSWPQLQDSNSPGWKGVATTVVQLHGKTMIYAILPLENDPILRIKPLGNPWGKDDGITFRRVSKSRASVAIFVDRPWVWHFDS